MTTAQIIAVGHVAGGEVHWRIAPLVTVTDADIEALIDEVYAKPALGIEDSAGLLDIIDYDGELEDQIEGRLDEDFWARGGW